MPKYAEFPVAYKYLKHLEGHQVNLGYVNKSKTDRGRETIGGISRRFNGDQELWVDVDELKKDPSFPNNLEGNRSLEIAIEHFYKTDYWIPMKGSSFQSQVIANEVFEFSVHKNINVAVETLQYCMNKLNYNQKLFKDLKEDGKIGFITLDALGVLCKRRGDVVVLAKMFNVEQGHYYNERFTESPNQEVNARGFYRRIQIKSRGK